MYRKGDWGGLEADLGLVAFESDVGSLGFDPKKGYGEKGL